MKGVDNMKYRISKYNPRYRDAEDRYMNDEWTDFSDIGRCFDEKIFTISEYRIVELNLLFVLYHLFLEKGIESFEINKMEKFTKSKWEGKKSLKRAQLEGKIYSQIMEYSKPGDKVDVAEMFALCQLILRNCLWCSITGKCQSDELQVDFGWDYYVYIYCTEISDRIIKLAEDAGIYIEKMN